MKGLLGHSRKLAALVLALCLHVTTSEADTLKLAVGQRGNWDTAIPELGQRAGIFAKQGLDLEILYTQGGGETQQAVISGSVNIGVAAGILGVLGAYSRGAPVRILGAETTGAADLFWYVKTDSQIRTLKDLQGKTIAYSTSGSSSNGIVRAFIAENNLQASPIATGSPSSTLTQLMSDQVQVGWSSPPFGLSLLDDGKIRIVATGNDATAFRARTVRLLITNVDTLKNRKDTLDRFMKAYRETIDWMYANPDAIKAYATFAGISEAHARRTRDDFFPKSSLDPDRIIGLEDTAQDAVNLKYTRSPLSQNQLSDLVQIPSR